MKAFPIYEQRGVVDPPHISRPEIWSHASNVVIFGVVCLRPYRFMLQNPTQRLACLSLTLRCLPNRQVLRRRPHLQIFQSPIVIPCRQSDAANEEKVVVGLEVGATLIG
jgi:hypothetical protein